MDLTNTSLRTVTQYTGNRQSTHFNGKERKWHTQHDQKPTAPVGAHLSNNFHEDRDCAEGINCLYPCIMLSPVVRAFVLLVPTIPFGRALVQPNPAREHHHHHSFQILSSRRSFLSTVVMIPILSTLQPTASARAESEMVTTVNRPFESNAFPKAELTNSIIASRDTNVSPMEVYDTLRSKLRKNANVTGARALDVGAGAGVSTQVLYQQLGYQTIDAIDWSRVAWQTNVVEAGYCPPTVHFYELDDERFLKEWRQQGGLPYDVIVFNFAVNKDKALYFCRNLLKPNGLLLAPINIQKDYWLKQSYQLFDSEGRVTWSTNDVGAWSVLFQPDVTQDTCQGIWCAPFNGFEKLRTYSAN